MTPPVEMTKGRAALPLSVVAEQDPVFSSPCVGRRPMTPPVEMTKGRAALPLSVVAEQDPLFIALGGPKAHDSSGREDKGEGGASLECGCGTGPVSSSP